MKLNIVPARTGIQWVKLGFQTFFKQPLALAGLVFVYAAACMLLLVVPFVGPIAVVMLVPAICAGLFVASERAANGTFPMPSLLLSAFRNGRQCTKSMLLLGLYYFVAGLVVGGIGVLLAGPPFEMIPGDGKTPPQIMVKRGFPVTFLLQLPLQVIFAYAAALVYWHAITPGKSLFFATMGFLRNFRALVTYAATWLLFFSVVLLVLWMVTAGRPMLVAPFFAPVGVLVIAVLFTSMYFSFCHTFVASPAEPAQPAPAGGESPP